MNKTNESDISNLILGNSSDIEIKIDKDISIMLNEKTPKTPKEAKAKRVTKPKKVKEIPVSQFKIEDPTYYYGSSPVLVKWKDWLLICNLVKASQTFKELYKEENFKYGDIEESGYVYPVYTKEPVEIKNLDGKVIETIPGIYDEDLTMVLPPKFIFGIYRRFLFSQQSLEGYITKIEQMPFEGFAYKTKFPPRDEQIELGNIAKEALSQRKYLNGIVQCPPGWGKAEINSTLIPTNEGFVQMGNIHIGMKVFDRYGKFTKVTGVFPQGKIPVWEVSFEDGTSTKCNSEHLWAINYGALMDEFGEIIFHSKKPLDIITTSDIKNLLDSGYLVEIPLCKPLSLEARRKLDIVEDTKQNCRALGYFVDEKDGCINIHRNHKRIIKIENLGYEEEQTCIMVENEEHLYLTENFTVTHNTYISIHIGSMVGAQVMVIVPNNLLKEQWVSAICEFTDLEEDDIGIVHGSDIAKITKKGHMSKPVVICLIQSLDSQLKRNDPYVLSEFYKNVGMVIYDETHTSGAADGYAKTTGIFTTFNVVGLSATPYKKDKNLFQLYTGIGTIFYISTHQNLIPSCNMHLLPIQISEKERRNIYDIFEKTNYNFFMSQLEDFLFKDHYYFQYLADWAEHRFKQGYSSVILFKTNKMLEKLDRYIQEKCEKTGLTIKTVILTNETAKKRKHEVSTADIVLSNYKMFSAGADYPHLSCVFFASMVLGKIPIIQTLGRVTRKYADKVQDVQAHFLIPKFIYPLYSNNEPHLTISRAVKLQYPEAQFKWDKGFTDHFQEKKQAAENLVAKDYKNFQQKATAGVPLNGTRNNGSYLIDANYDQGNRLGNYMQHQQPQQPQGTGEFQRPPSLLPES